MSTATLEGRRALVTGGSRGIGAQTVRRLADDGAVVAFTYSASGVAAENLVAEVAERGGKAVAIAADAADSAQLAAAVDHAASELGGLDIVVNNAAIASQSLFEEVTPEEFDRLLAVNVGGVFWTTQSALKHLPDGARIINIGSVSADRMSEPGTLAYALTKGAVQTFTLALARELGPRGITVNTVQPGPINTEMNPDDGDLAQRIKGVTALGRYGTTGEVAAVVSFLAGPESGYVTGAHWNVDGGFTV